MSSEEIYIVGTESVEFVYWHNVNPVKPVPIRVTTNCADYEGIEAGITLFNYGRSITIRFN